MYPNAGGDLLDRGASVALLEEEAAGRKTGISPKRKAVTATSSTIDSTLETVNQVETPTDFSSSVNDTPSHGSIDFPYLRSQITLERVLRHLGYFDRLRGAGPQRRGPGGERW